MQLNASKMRGIVSEILGRVLRAGKVSESPRKSRTEGIVVVQVSSKLSRLVRRDYLRCDPKSIVHLDWLGVAGGID
jgi:hypothetical protein